MKIVKESEIKLIKPLDIILIAVIFIFSVGFFLINAFNSFSFSTEDLQAVIRQNGNVIRVIDLNSDEVPCTIDIGGEYDVKIFVDSKGAYFISSECPDKLCIKTGKITAPGKTAVCLPAEISVEIAASNSKIDAIVG